MEREREELSFHRQERQQMLSALQPNLVVSRIEALSKSKP